MLMDAGIALSAQEESNIEIAHFGLNRLEVEGLQIIVYVNNELYCAKELVMFPRQTCPEHRHPPFDSSPGKTETFRVRRGGVWLYVQGTAMSPIKALIPAVSRDYYTVFHELELQPGSQFTIAPNTKHWFQAGDYGAIVSEFSSTSRDELDVFTDPNIRRIPVRDGQVS